ncbi:MAG: helix-turn-helix domain-containing protein [Bryobacterales bacterium]|nr:helix-turn-helix domain-containing protein [Bryobacterales bacterium]MBV9400302.1 helix-turn-helix domain-containing protein [Bryobacterales bacterium]
MRAAILLLVAKGFQNADIAHRLKVTERTVTRLKKRFYEGGFSAIETRPGQGRPPNISPDDCQRVIIAASTVDPGGQRPGIRFISMQTGVSPTTVWRILRRYGFAKELTT